MGFSLALFIEELEFLLSDLPKMTDAQKIQALKECVEWNKKYAKECEK
jgi:Na+/H+ antiporter NhaA